MNRETFNATFEKSEFVWTTWDGVRKNISEIDHQHLSNIIHFMKYVNSNYRYSTKFEITNELYRRFEGVLLPYRPIGTYKPEIDFLQEQGYLVKNDLHNKYDIIIFGEKVGEYQPIN